MSFASKLQLLRQEHGISQEELAEMLNVSRQSVSKWERGKGYPEIDKLIHISERFSISLDDLLKDRPASASGRFSSPRKAINLSKECVTMPESESEPDCGYPERMRTAYPVNSAQEEIYPQNTQPADRHIFHHEVVSSRGGLAQYNNYSTGESSSSQADRQAERRNRHFNRRKKFSGRKLSWSRLILATVLFGIPIIWLVSYFIYSMNVPRYFSSGSTYDLATEVAISEPDEYYYEDLLRFMIDESTGTRYVFVSGDDRGIVTSLADTDLNRCTKLTDLSTGQTLYCEEYYYSENAVISPEGCEHVYVIPHYLLSTDVPYDSQNNFRPGQDSNSKSWFYVPLYITAKCEEAFLKSTRNEVSGVQYEADPNLEEEIKPPADNYYELYPEDGIIENLS